MLVAKISSLRGPLLFIVFCFIITPSLSQNATDFQLREVPSQPLRTFLVGLEKEQPVRFFFQDEWLEGYTIDSTFNGMTLKDALWEILGNDLQFTEISGNAIVIVKDPSLLRVRDEIIRNAMDAKKEIEEKIIGDPSQIQRRKKIFLSGSVTGGQDQSPLPNVVILSDNERLGQTDASGKYKVSLSPGTHVLEYRFVNFKDHVIDLKIYSDGVIDLSMEETPVMLDEVVVSDQPLVNSEVGQTRLKMTDIKRATTFFGEIDVIKQIQNQPGVTTVGEVATGFNVRGGGVDQNLVMYDGVPIFNTSHALGFFTAFNADAIRDVSFYRGGIPAEFGGRASSVMTITSEEGPDDRIHGKGGIGIISSYATIGVPIIRDKTSLQISYRTSYSDWMLKAIKSNFADIDNSSMYFYDGSVKLTHKFSGRTKFTFSGYTSLDRFSFTNDSTFSPRNLALSAQLGHSFNDKLYTSLSLGMGEYSYSVEERDPGNAFRLMYGVRYPFFKMDFNHEGAVHKLSFGLHSMYYDFEPGSLKPMSSESITSRVDMLNERSLESALYLSDAFDWNERFHVEAGIRLSMFNRVGPGTVYSYEENKPLEPRNIIDSTMYDDGDIMKTYMGFEPRLSVRYLLDKDASIKFGYNRMYQYLHLVTNTAAVTPVDIWQSSNEYFKPQIADQVSLGYYRNLRDREYEAFVELFYKTFQNALDFKDGANLILNKHLEAALVSGSGRAYGAEFSVEKITGRLLGTFSYTYSRSWRTMNGRFSQEKINNGDAYPSNYDQPHVTTLTWRYNLSRRYFFSGTFTYHTGRPMSLPQSTYVVDGVPIPDFSDRNKFRIPDYHRLDLAFIIEGNHRRKKVLDGTWVFSFYNVYARKNAYSVYFEDVGQGQLRPYKLAVIGTIVPSVTYTFKF